MSEFIRLEIDKCFAIINVSKIHVVTVLQVPAIADAPQHRIAIVSFLGDRHENYIRVEKETEIVRLLERLEGSTL